MLLVTRLQYTGRLPQTYLSQGETCRETVSEGGVSALRGVTLFIAYSRVSARRQWAASRETCSPMWKCKFKGEATTAHAALGDGASFRRRSRRGHRGQCHPWGKTAGITITAEHTQGCDYASCSRLITADAPTMISTAGNAAPARTFDA